MYERVFFMAKAKAEAEDYFESQQHIIDRHIVNQKYMDQYVVTSKNRKYVSKRIDLLVDEGWRLKSQNVDKDGFIRAVMVK